MTTQSPDKSEGVDVCGGCGISLATAPWEVQLLGGGRAVRREIAQELTEQSRGRTGARVAVNSFGIGYVISSPGGKRVLAETLDQAVDALDFDEGVPVDESHRIGLLGPSAAAVVISRLRGRVALGGSPCRVQLAVDAGVVDVVVDASGVRLGVLAAARPLVPA